MVRLSNVIQKLICTVFAALYQRSTCNKSYRARRMTLVSTLITVMGNRPVRYVLRMIRMIIKVAHRHRQRTRTAKTMCSTAVSTSQVCKTSSIASPYPNLVFPV